MQCNSIVSRSVKGETSLAYSLPIAWGKPTSFPLNFSNDMNTPDIKHRLIHALTDYDRKQSTKRSYNPHALGIYFVRVDEICADIDKGSDVRAALMAGLSGRILDVALKAVGLPLATREEHQNGNYVYIPVKS